MNEKKQCIAVIDVGSSAIRGCVGYKDESQVLHVLSAESRPVGDEVRRGMVCNVKGAAKIVRDVIDALQQNEESPCRISQVLVSLNAASLRSKEVKTGNGLQGAEEVTESILEEMKFDCEMQVPEGKELFYSSLKDYTVDGFRSQSPLGEKPKLLEASYTLVYGKQEIQQDLAGLFAEIGVDFTLAPGAWASASLVIPQEERKRGAVAVNFGSDTTAVCVVKDDKVCYLVVIPIGGQSITNDLHRIMSLEEAETEKTDHGSAIHYTMWKNGIGPSDLALLKELPQRDKNINEVVVARSEEIVANVWNQIQASGIGLQDAKIYLTGGASRLKDLDVLMANKTNMSVVKVDENPHLAESCPQVCLTPEFSQCVGLLTMDCNGGCVLEEKLSETAEAQQPAEQQSAGKHSDQPHDNDVSSDQSLFGDIIEMLPWRGKKKATQQKKAPRAKDNPQSPVEKTVQKVEKKGMAIMDSIFSELEKS